MVTRKVLHGDRVRGLIEYLYGPGRHEEHRDPHIIGAWDDTYLNRGHLDQFEIGLLADELDAPRRIHGVDPGKGHVYHVPVSLHVDDGELTDEQWREIAEYAADQLGFTERDGRAGVPWIAVRHGVSKNGNDHIHFVATLLREDGTIPDIRGDYRTWSRISQEIETRFGLTRTRSKGAGLPGLTRGEIAKAEREGEPETARETLARQVRACATGARDEADFLRRARRAGLLIRPRWEQGGRTTVVGYSVALRPSEKGTKPIWFGGGKLADDLTLPDLRARWQEPTEDQAADAFREWRPPGWRDLPTGRQLRTERLRAEAWESAGTVVAEIRQRIAGLDPHDTAGWATVSRETAGALAALAQRVEPDRRAELKTAADALARVAQTEHGETARPVPEMSPMIVVARTAVDAYLASRGGPLAVASLVMQIGRLVEQIRKAHEAAQREAQAWRAAQAERALLEHVRRAPAPPPAPAPEPIQTTRRTPERAFGEAPRTAAQRDREADRDRER